MTSKKLTEEIFTKEREDNFKKWANDFKKKTGKTLMVNGEPATARNFHARACEIENELLRKQANNT